MDTPKLPKDVKYIYVEGVGFVYSDENPVFFKILPIKEGEITYDPTGPRYIIMFSKVNHTNEIYYIQWNVDSGKTRVIMASKDPFDVKLLELSNDSLDIVVQRIKKLNNYNGFIKMIKDNQLVGFYNAQQEYKRAAMMINNLSKDYQLVLHS